LIGFAGWSGAGKTTLIVKLIPELNRRGLSVSTIKHAHHNFDLDQPGKDSYEHRAAGAAEVLVASANRVALMRELRGAPEPSLPELLRLLKPVDLVLIEGFKRDPVPKIEIFRLANAKPPMHPEDPHIVALISDLEQRAIERSGHREERSDEAIQGNVGRPAALDRHVGRRPPRDDDSTRKHLPPVGPVGSLPHASIDDIAAAADLVLAHAEPLAAVLAELEARS
jgi:molybdopterin-guanine dinucleotide biosynthesis adapter protein